MHIRTERPRETFDRHLALRARTAQQDTTALGSPTPRFTEAPHHLYMELFHHISRDSYRTVAIRAAPDEIIGRVVFHRA